MEAEKSTSLHKAVSFLGQATRHVPVHTFSERLSVHREIGLLILRAAHVVIELPK